MNLQYDKLAAFAVWKGGERKIGVADVTLPDIEYMTESIKGAGIAGEVDMPTAGHTSSMTTSLNWRTINGDNIDLIAPKAHDLEFRGAQQVFEAGSGEFLVQEVKINIRGLPKKGGIGKMDTSAKTDSSNELETIYLKVTIDGVVKIEIDKFNYKHVINGTDYMLPFRAALGIY